MQPSDLQVQRSMAALRRVTDDPDDRADAPARHEVPPELFERLEEGPRVRRDRVDAAKARLEDGDEPSADDVATKLVGRLVCDRLR